MGLSVNKGKTGSLQVSADTRSPTIVEELLKGPIRWGFLTLNTSGEWTINDNEVDDHVEELRRQLSACKSVFAWVQAWNTYVSKFFASNFG